MHDRPLRFIVIGAGMAGMLAAIKLRNAGHEDLVIYEKGDRVGGTWRENTYPGLTCDVPAHHYTYTFRRNPNWTRHLSPGAEIQNYFEDVAREYELERITRFNTEVSSAEFVNGRWQLLLDDGSEDSADVVIAATGVLHVPNYPMLKGLDQFGGKVFHTARWDHSVDLDSARIAVLGMGSTGVQIVSDLTARGIETCHFVRTPQWIMPVENGYFTEEQRAAFAADPRLLHEAMDFESYSNGVEQYTLALTQPESEGARAMQQACRDNLLHGIADDELRAQLTPDHEPLCKRLIFSPDYYDAIQRDCATLVRTDIEAVEQRGIRTKDGVLHEVDVIALATGFHTDRFMRPMKIKGRNGVDLETLWARRPTAYLAISMPDMPNFFMLNGPNGPVGNFSLIEIAEHQWGFIEHLIDKLASGAAREIAAKREALEAFEQERIEAAKTTVWYTGGCKSWYLDAEGIPSSWPWTFSRFVDEMREPRWDCFEQVS